MSLRPRPNVQTTPWWRYGRCIDFETTLFARCKSKKINKSKKNQEGIKKDQKNHVCNKKIKETRTDFVEWFTPGLSALSICFAVGNFVSLNWSILLFHNFSILERICGGEWQFDCTRGRKSYKREDHLGQDEGNSNLPYWRP